MRFMLSGIHDDLPTAAIATACGVLALVAVTIAAVYAVRRAMRLRRVESVARLLIDAHLTALEQQSMEAFDKTEPLANHSEQLAENVAELMDSADRLRTLLGAIPRYRRQMRQDLIDLIRWSDSAATAQGARDR